MLILSILAIGCIIIFRGHTESLIPLYAIGVFIPFTLALLCIARHRAFTWQMIIPCIAAILTLTVVITLVITKPLLISPVLLFVPIIIFLCNKTKKHYEQVQAQLYMTEKPKSYKGQLIIVPISDLHASTRKALQLVQLQHQQVVGLFIGSTNEEVKNMKRQWAKEFPTIRLVAFVSSNQQLLLPLLRVIGKLKVVAQKHSFHLAICIPQLVVPKQWQNLLHNHHAFLLKQALLKDSDLSVISISYKIK